MLGITLINLYSYSFIVTLSEKDSLIYLSRKLSAEKYAHVLDIFELRINRFKIIIPLYVNESQLEEIVTYRSNSIEELHNFVFKFGYNINQNNPLVLKELGGNCQAMNLYYAYLLRENGFKVKFKIGYLNTIPHIWLQVLNNDKWQNTDGSYYKFYSDLNYKEVSYE